MKKVEQQTADLKRIGKKNAELMSESKNRVGSKGKSREFDNYQMLNQVFMDYCTSHFEKESVQEEEPAEFQLDGGDLDV